MIKKLVLIAVLSVITAQNALAVRGSVATAVTCGISGTVGVVAGINSVFYSKPHGMGYINEYYSNGEKVAIGAKYALATGLAVGTVLACKTPTVRLWLASRRNAKVLNNAVVKMPMNISSDFLKQVDTHFVLSPFPRMQAFDQLQDSAVEVAKSNDQLNKAQRDVQSESELGRQVAAAYAQSLELEQAIIARTKTLKSQSGFFKQRIKYEKLGEAKRQSEAAEDQASAQQIAAWTYFFRGGRH